MRIVAAIALALALAAPGIAAAEPALPRVLTAPTAWLPGAGALVATAGLDHRGNGTIEAAYGLGALAELELGADDDIRGPALAHAAFRIGAHQDAWFAGQPALVLGFQSQLGTPSAAQAYVVASRVLGPLTVHAGAAALDARVATTRLGATVRPLAAIELVPPQYPKTSLLLDVAWEPRLDESAPALEWVGGLGVRYQALRWGAIELDIRHRERDDLGATTVMVRVDGVWRR